MELRKLWNRTFWTGVAVGVGLILLGRVVINESTFPDRLVAPLLIPDSSAHADAIVVLGAGVIGDCVPNLNGMRRAMLGARLFRDGRAPLLVITGGGSRGACPVADAMAHVAREYGVPEDKLLLERRSRNTHENGELTAPLLRERHIARVLLVTDKLHMSRGAGVFQRLGFAVEPVSVPVYAGHIDNVSMLSEGIREAAALTYYRLRGWTGFARAGGASLASSNAVTGDGQPVKPAAVQTSGSPDRRPVVILGASYAAGWKLADVDSVPVINAGIAGQQSFELLARFDAGVVAARPRAVVLWGFINDIFRADDVQRAMTRTRDSYTEMVKRARANGIEPILATEVTVRPPKTFTQSVMSAVGPLLGKVSYQDRVNEQVIATNRWLRELAQREGLLMLDLHAALADTNGRRRYEFATPDGSHISPEGYEALTVYARPLLADRFRATAGAKAVRP